MLALMIIYIMISPVLAIIMLYCLKLEKQHDNQKDAVVNKKTYGCYPTLNKLRGTSKPLKKNVIKKNDALNDFLEQYSKILTISMTEKSSFVIPKEVCGDIATELKSWLDNKAEVQYAVIEEDGLHVKMEAK